MVQPITKNGLSRTFNNNGENKIVVGLVSALLVINIMVLSTQEQQVLNM